VTGAEATHDTSVAYLFYPCNCSDDLTWAWPTYNTLAALESVSEAIVVGQVTSAMTVGVNISAEEYALPPPVKGLVPLTGYNITATTILLGGTYLKPGATLFVSQVGGMAGGTTMSVAGYPTLSVGQSYVFFLALPGCLNYVEPAQNELAGLYDVLHPASALITAGGPQGLFPIQGGNVYSLDYTYPQADAWLPIKVSAVPLAQFIQEVQSAKTSASSAASSTTSPITTTFTTTVTGC